MADDKTNPTTEETVEETKDVKTEENVEDVKETSAETAEEIKVETSDEKSEVKSQKSDQDNSQHSEPSGKFKNLIETIEKLTVLELSELVKELEDRFGISAAAPVAMATGAAAAPAEEAEEKTSFTVVLADAGVQKIAVIKAVREIRQDLGLVEAKTLVEKGDAEVLKDVKKEAAEEAKTKLETAGAKVELK